MSGIMHPHKEIIAPVLAPHHCAMIISAVDSGTEAPNRENPPHPLVESHIPNSENDIGRLASEFGLNQSVKAVVQSLPFKNGQDMENLLFNRVEGEVISPQQQQMIDSIFEENMRQEMNIAVEPMPAPSMSLDQALDGEDGLTPPDADPERTGKWSSLRAR